MDLKQGAGLAGQGLPPSPPDVVMSMDSALFSRMFRGNHGNPAPYWMLNTRLLPVILLLWDVIMGRLTIILGYLSRGAEAHDGLHDREAAYPWRHDAGYQAGEDDGGHEQIQAVAHVARNTSLSADDPSRFNLNNITNLILLRLPCCL